jgi:hypothetical protein
VFSDQSPCASFPFQSTFEGARACFDSNDHPIARIGAEWTVPEPPGDDRLEFTGARTSRRGTVFQLRFQSSRSRGTPAQRGGRRECEAGGMSEPELSRGTHGSILCEATFSYNNSQVQTVTITTTAPLSRWR